MVIVEFIEGQYDFENFCSNHKNYTLILTILECILKRIDKNSENFQSLLNNTCYFLRKVLANNDMRCEKCSKFRKEISDFLKKVRYEL